ncbi:MAG: hypothetical protein JO153_14780 [Solirubrobacterales bacterium]|nr:hypothetical protein [Solirubrobacterales bacterium]MBV9917769.1 hypothetical protein [Solirubrobacterales bacterium]
MFLFNASTSAPTWISAFGAVLTGVAALLALGLVGLNETRKLRSQHRQDERRRLQALIGRYHGPLLEAAIDWDRRMHQLLSSKRADVGRYGNDAEGLTEMEWFMDDRTHYDTDDWVYGKFCNPDEYMFRSFVFRFLVLCSLARKFEAEAFYHDAQVARDQDFQFLKYAKAFLWAPTHGDLHPDEIPSQDHFPNDEFRPILDKCYRANEGAVGEQIQIFDLVHLSELVGRERGEYAERLRSLRAEREMTPLGAALGEPDEGEAIELEAEAEQEANGRVAVATEISAAPRPQPRGIGRVILFFIGLRRPSWREDDPRRLTRYNWDRLCVLHLLVMAFINEFGYQWQQKTPHDLRATVDAIVDPKVALRFDTAIESLGLAAGRGPRARRGMLQVKVTLRDRIRQAASTRSPAPAQRS